MDLETLLVQHHLAVLGIEVAPDLLDEVRRDVLLFRKLDHRHRRGDRLVRDVAPDLVLLDHAVEDMVAAHARLVGGPERGEGLGALHQPGEKRGLRQRHPLRRLPEVVLRRGLDAVATVPHVDLVAVEAEDFLLGERLLDLHRQHHLLELPADRLLRLQEQRAGQLLRDGAAPLRLPEVDDVRYDGARDPPRVDADVLIEMRVLRRDQGLEELLGDLVGPDDDALLGAELEQNLPVGAVDGGHDGRLPVLQPLDLGDIEGQEIPQDRA